MIVFVNGNFVPEAEAVVSVFDRGFLYGDGLFEAIRFLNGKPFRWKQHLQRLMNGAAFLKINLPYSPDSLRRFADELVARNLRPDALLRLTLSRGVGLRGYSPKGADRPSVVMSLHPTPAHASGKPRPLRVVSASFRLPASEPLAQFKTCNKLPQILARAEAELAGADEALLLNTNGHIVEGSSSNLFWLKQDSICTPPIASGILPGVTRAVVLELCSCLGLAVRETRICSKELHHAEGAFLSLTSLGIVEISSIDGTPLPHSPKIEHLTTAYEHLLQTETGLPTLEAKA